MANFAQVKAGVIQNIIFVADVSNPPIGTTPTQGQAVIIGADQPTLVQSIFGAGFDALVQVDGMDPAPQIGWTTSDNATFLPPDSP